MELSFLGQGFGDTGNPVGSVLSKSLTDERYTRFISLAAFARSSGIRSLNESLQESKDNIDEFSIVVGIDQNGTSEEALEDLLELDIGASIFYTRSPSTYHPKIYIFDGEDQGRVIIGSSNLTNSGLFRNIESSILVDFERPDREGEELVNEVREYYEPLLTGDSPNVHELSADLIAMLVESDLVQCTAISIHPSFLN